MNTKDMDDLIAAVQRLRADKNTDPSAAEIGDEAQQPTPDSETMSSLRRKLARKGLKTAPLNGTYYNASKRLRAAEDCLPVGRGKKTVGLLCDDTEPIFVAWKKLEARRGIGRLLKNAAELVEVKALLDKETFAELQVVLRPIIRVPARCTLGSI